MCIVWSFGVVIWEIVTCQDPWPELSPVEAALSVSLQRDSNHFLIEYQVLSNGLRLQFPADSDRNVVEIAQLCWKNEAEDRPDFSQLCHVLSPIEPPGTIVRRWSDDVRGERVD